MKKGGTAFTTGLMAALIVIMVAPVMAQVRPVAARATGEVASIETNAEEVDLLVGRSAVIRTERPIKRVSLPKPEIADALVTSPTELLVHGKAPGTISLLLWNDAGKISSYRVVVQRDLSSLEERVRQLFPGEPITVTSNGADVVLSGVVSSDYVAEKATSLALGYVEKKENVVNLLRQDQGLESNQVLLRVRFAEVSRSAMQELGVSMFTGPGGYKDWIARSTTSQFPAPDFEEGKLVFSDFLNILAFNTKEQLGAVVKALQTKGLFQSLAEPNLVTQNGKEATFLAGGEFPFPVVQGGGANQTVTIMFKEFGVRLRFTPTITGQDSIHLKVAPEVSSLDFSNALAVEGFRVPAIATRRTETEVELRDGQTFAIAGLIDNSVNQTVSKIPGLGDIPILGLLFKSRAYQKNATELVVMITPQILRRDSVGVTDQLPRMPQPFIPYEEKTLPPPAPAFSTPEARSVAPVGDASAEAAARPVAPNAPAGAVAPARPALSKTPELKAADKAKADDKRAREAEKADAARLERERQEAEKAARTAEEQERRQAELDRKAALKQAEIDREEAKKAEKAAIEEAKRQAELDRQQAELDRKREAEERKQAERDRKEQEKLEKEREKLERERAKRAAAEQEIAEKLEKMRAEEERKKEEERREEQERIQRERAKRDPWPRLRSRI